MWQIWLGEVLIWANYGNFPDGGGTEILTCPKSENGENFSNILCDSINITTLYFWMKVICLILIISVI